MKYVIVLAAGLLFSCCHVPKKGAYKEADVIVTDLHLEAKSNERFVALSNGDTVTWLRPNNEMVIGKKYHVRYRIEVPNSGWSKYNKYMSRYYEIQ